MDFLDGDGGFASDPYSFPYPDASGTGTIPDFPSELGGTADQWNPPIDDTQVFDGSYGGYTSEESGPVAGPDLSFPDFPGLPGMDPSVFLNSQLFGGGGGASGGGGMDFDTSALVPYAGGRGIPWGAMTKQVASAARYFGPALLMPIVQLVANYWTARLQKLGLSITITPGALLMKFLTRKGKGRRSRGITGRQLTITSRTIGKVERMHQRIRAVCSRAGVGRSHSRSYFPRRRHRR